MKTARYEVRWTMTEEFIDKHHQVHREYEDYVETFEEFNDVISFLEHKHKEWEKQNIYNVLIVKDLLNHQLYEYRNALHNNVNEWLEYYNIKETQG